MGRVIPGTFIHACRTRDKSKVVELLRNDYPLTDWDKEALADLIDGAGKRRRGNPRKPNKWVAIAAEVATDCKAMYYRLGWKPSRRRGGISIDKLAVDSAIAFMEFE